MLRKVAAILVLGGLLAGPLIVHAQEALSEGEVKKVDKDAGKLTIKHGPLDNLGMPAMTMVFHVADPAMLDEVAPGDKITFLAEKVGGFLTVTQLHPEH
jgi:Cu(I)/Ag(I) efflux system periplasmic protein CusF